MNSTDNPVWTLIDEDRQSCFFQKVINVFCFLIQIISILVYFHSISGKCILNMDHFCPWMSNCVGYYNYRYFVLFLFYMFVGSLYVLSTSAKCFFFVLPRGRYGSPCNCTVAGREAAWVIALCICYTCYLPVTYIPHLFFYISSTLS